MSLHDCDRLARMYHEDPDQQTRDKVCRASAGLIRSIITRLRAPSDYLARHDDLYQVGIIALLQALDTFDPSRGIRFTSFAYPRVRGEVVDYLRRLDPLPRRRRCKVARVRAAADRLRQQHGDSVTDRHIASDLGLTLPDVQQTRTDELRRYSESLFDERKDGGLRLIDCMPDTAAQDALLQHEWTDIRMYLAGLAAGLDERDRMILELYFVEELTLAEISLLIGVSEARVSQLRTRALNELRSRIDVGLRYAA